MNALGMLGRGIQFTAGVFDTVNKLRIGAGLIVATGVVGPYAWDRSKPYLASAASAALTVAKTTALIGGALAVAGGGYVAARHLSHKTSVTGGRFDLVCTGWNEKTLERIHAIGPPVIQALSLLPLAYLGYSIL